jgi:hypothetical protein
MTVGQKPLTRSHNTRHSELLKEEPLREKLKSGSSRQKDLDLRWKGHYKPGDGQTKRGKRFVSPWTPSEILFELQMKVRGYIEVDVALRTPEPYDVNRHIVGRPVRIKGLEPGEIMKLKRDIEGFLIWWRGELARERADAELLKRVDIEETTRGDEAETNTKEEGTARPVD